VRRDGREVTTDEIVDWRVKVRVTVERTKVVWLEVRAGNGASG
jgi:hypothetical protein